MVMTLTIEQYRKILERIVELEKDIAALKKARTDAALNGFASATISSGGGSRSYSRFDLDKITILIGALLKELAQYRNMLFNGGKAKTINTIETIYS